MCFLLLNKLFYQDGGENLKKNSFRYLERYQSENSLFVYAGRVKRKSGLKKIDVN